MILGLTVGQQDLVLPGVLIVLGAIIRKLWRDPSRKPFAWENRARRKARQLVDEAAAYMPSAYLPAGRSLAVATGPALRPSVVRAGNRIDRDGRNYAAANASPAVMTALIAEQTPDVAELTVTGRPRQPLPVEYPNGGIALVDPYAHLREPRLQRMREEAARPVSTPEPIGTLLGVELVEDAAAPIEQPAGLLQRIIGHGEAHVFDGNDGATESYAGTLHAVDLTAAADLPGDFETPEARKVDQAAEDAEWQAMFSALAQRQQTRFDESFARDVERGADPAEIEACRAAAEAQFIAEQAARSEVIADITGELVHA